MTNGIGKHESSNNDHSKDSVKEVSAEKRSTDNTEKEMAKKQK